MKTQIKKMKEELKELAKSIKTNKPLFKDAQRSGNWEKQWKYCTIAKSSEFRYKHIAYCILRGRTLEQIEGKNREGNKPNMDYINKIIKGIKDEALRNSEIRPIEVTTGSASGTCGS